MLICTCTYMCIYLSLSLSLYMYVYIYIYTYKIGAEALARAPKANASLKTIRLRVYSEWYRISQSMEKHSILCSSIWYTIL